LRGERISLFSISFYRTSRPTNSFRSGNGKRGGTRGGRSRNGWSNTKSRKQFYGAKKKNEDDRNGDSRASPEKKRGGGRGRGRGRGGGNNNKKKKAAQ
jgi:hypothetical protein